MKEFDHGAFDYMVKCHLLKDELDLGILHPSCS